MRYKEQLKLVFAELDDDGSGDLSRQEVAEFEGHASIAVPVSNMVYVRDIQRIDEFGVIHLTREAKKRRGIED